MFAFLSSEPEEECARTDVRDHVKPHSESKMAAISELSNSYCCRIQHLPL